jgi:hypothetical protein
MSSPRGIKTEGLVGVLNRSFLCCLFFLFGVRVVVSFSMRFKILKMGWSGPRAVNILRRLFMSVVLDVLVRVAAVRYIAE